MVERLNPHPSHETKARRMGHPTAPALRWVENYALHLQSVDNAWRVAHLLPVKSKLPAPVNPKAWPPADS